MKYTDQELLDAAIKKEASLAVLAGLLGVGGAALGGKAAVKGIGARLTRSSGSMLPGLRSASEANMVRRISSVFGPHAAQGLQGPIGDIERASLHKLLQTIPKGGTTAGADLSQVAPEFARQVLKGRKLRGEELNRILPHSRRTPTVSADAPDTVAGMLAQTAKRHPLGTLAAGGGIGALASKLLKKDEPKSGGSGRAIMIA